jgi:hypothetical protein
LGVRGGRFGDLSDVGMRNPTDSFTVPEIDSTDECWVGVYTSDSDVLVVLSCKSDGDAEFYFTNERFDG